MWCCVWCGMADENMNTILTHIESEHAPNAPVRCKHCSMVCHSMHDMDNHYATSHPKTAPVLCPECPKICHNKNELIIHMKSHRNEDRVATENDYICHLCGLLYKDVNDITHTQLYVRRQCHPSDLKSPLTQRIYTDLPKYSEPQHVSPCRHQGI